MEIHHTGVFTNTPLFKHNAQNTPQSPGSKETESSTDSIQQSKAAEKQFDEDPLQDPAIQRQLSELRARDREVRAHELAHAAAAGSLVRSGPTYEYQRGPDGQLYAIGGEVQIDTSGVPGDPEATLEKAIKIQQAALAPAQPSTQDRAVAVAAAAMAAEARAELNSQKSDTQDAQEKPNSQSIIARAQDAYRTASKSDQPRSTSLVDVVA